MWGLTQRKELGASVIASRASRFNLPAHGLTYMWLSVFGSSSTIVRPFRLNRFFC